ncbi:MAG: ABC transporter permease [Saprospiraceae bacterium]
MSQSNIPKWADKFLQWYCRPELLEEIQGDLYELFDLIETESGPQKARANFIWNVLRSFRLSTIKKGNISMSIMPFKSHFKVAYRQLWKQRSQTLVNAFGLVLGFACCLMIGLYIRDELSFDTMHPQKDQVYRLLSYELEDGKASRGIYHNPPLVGLLSENLPEVQDGFRVRTTDSRLIKTGPDAQNSYEQYLIYADQSMLDLFYFPLKYGDRHTALKEPNTVVLTEEKAVQYFGKTDPVGKNIFLNNNQSTPFRVTGVIKETGAKSHLAYDFYLSMETLGESKSGSWERSSYPTYLSIAEGTDIKALEAKILNLTSAYKADLEELGISYELQPVEDIYLKSQTVTTYGHWLSGDPRYLWLFGSIALVILLVAIINFVNLSTARSANRLAEVGIRKIMGSNRRQLISQFLVESVLQSVFALLLAILLVWSGRPFFEQLSGKTLSIPNDVLGFVLVSLGASILIGLLAGTYPAFYISNFSPLNSIKNALKQNSKGKLQWSLVAIQFSTSFVLIFSTILIYRQMHYIQDKNLGFDRERVIILEDSYAIGEQITTFKSQLQQLSDIESVTLSSYIPVDGYRLNGSTFQHPDSVAGSKEVELRRWFIDEDYLETLGMQLKEGRNFSANGSLDSNAIILNETAAKMLGYVDVLDKPLRINQQNFQVVGIVEDFHFRSMRQNILPLAFHKTNLRRISSTIIKTKSDNYENLLGEIQGLWGAFAPNQPLRYNFMDERFDQMYTAERRVGLTFVLFTIMAIFIASLGLLALTSFIAENRKKELSIRKVLGASVSNIFRLQTQLFGNLLIIAFLLGIPIAYYLMQQWLRDFAYRIAISWDIFFLSMLLTFLLIAATVSLQAIRIAKANPVEALRGD